MGDSWAQLWTVARGSLSLLQESNPDFDLKLEWTEHQLWTQYMLLRNLDLLNIGMVDSCFLDEVCKIPPDMQYDEAKEAVKSIVIQKMCDQIDRGGTTVGLRLDELHPKSKYTELHKLTEKIVRLRKDELEIVEVIYDLDGCAGRVWTEFPEEEEYLDCYDLRGLWLTAIGNEILKELRMSLSTSSRGLDMIFNECKRRGYGLYDVEILEMGDFSPLSKMSDEMQELILSLVDTR